jgi:hypothetical protein
MTKAFNHLLSRTLKNICKLWFGAKLHSTILPMWMDGLCLYPFGVPKNVQLYSGMTPWAWRLVRQNTVEQLINKCTQLSELCIKGMVEKKYVNITAVTVPILIFTLNKF